jgi:hypothetical protein
MGDLPFEAGQTKGGFLHNVKGPLEARHPARQSEPFLLEAQAKALGFALVDRVRTRRRGRPK